MGVVETRHRHFIMNIKSSHHANNDHNPSMNLISLASILRTGTRIYGTQPASSWSNCFCQLGQGYRRKPGGQSTLSFTSASMTATIRWAMSLRAMLDSASDAMQLNPNGFIPFLADPDRSLPGLAGLLHNHAASLLQHKQRLCGPGRHDPHG